MSAKGYGGRALDTLIIPYIFVRDGEEVPPEWLARNPNSIRIPAVFERSDDGENRMAPSLELNFDDEPSATRHDFARSETGFGETVVHNEPSASEPATDETWRADPIAAYIRLDRYLSSMGFGHGAAASGETLSAVGSVSDTRTPSTQKDKAELQDPTTPVPFVDDQGRPVLNSIGEPMLRPAGLDPHLFVQRGLAARMFVEEMIQVGGVDGAVAAAANELRDLTKFLWWQPWMLSGSGGDFIRSSWIMRPSS